MTSPRGAALVTGAGRRIGRALALAAAEAGFDVAVHYRASASEAQDTADAIAALGRRAVLLEAELRAEDQVAALVGRAAQALGPVTLLVNSASTFADDRLRTHDRAGWDAHVEANLRAPIVLSQAFAAALPEGTDGLIVNLVDQRVWKPNPQFFSYSLSKSALWNATRILAQALAPRIRVNGIGPGPTLPSVHQTEAAFRAEAANVPLQRRAEPAEIVAAALYLIDAPSVTGQMIAVDGGQHLAWLTPDIVLP